MVYYLPSRLWDIAMPVHQIHANPRNHGVFVPMLEITGTTETDNAVMRYTKSLTTSPTVARLQMFSTYTI